MKPLYASNISISNFRALPADFELPIPAEPGLVIVYGMNGLGKTTLFEALEWLFTGEVMRLRDRLHNLSQHDKNLTRHGASPMSHRVSLSFDDSDASLSRTATEGPSPSEVIDSLSDPDWTPRPNDPKPYMRLTMFLPQTKKYRFDSESGKDKWRMLEEPAGVDRLNQIRLALVNQSTTKAFRRAIESRGNVLETANEKLKQWEELLKSREQLAVSLAHPDLVTPESALTTLTAARSKLRNNAGNNQSQPSESDPTDDIRIFAGETLREARDASQTATDHLEELKNAAEGVTEWEEKSRELAGLKKKFASASTTKKEMNAAVKAASESSSKLQTERSNREAARKSASQIVEDLRTLIKTEKSVGESELLAKQQLGLTHEISALLQDATQLRGGVIKQEATLKSLLAEKQQIEAYRKRVDKFDADVDVFDQGGAQAESESAELMRYRDQLSSTNEAIPKLQSEIIAKKQRLGELETQKKNAVAESDRMTKAIASVCDHIASDATTCPVCRQKYESGELRKRAEESLKSAGVDTKAMDEEINQQRSDLLAIEKSLNDRNTLTQQLPIQIAELSRRMEERAKQSSLIEVEAKALTVDQSDIKGSLTVQREQADKRDSQIELQLQELEDFETNQRVLTVVSDSIASLEKELATRQEFLRTIEPTVQQDQSTVSSLLATLGQSAGGHPSNRETALKEAMARQASIITELAQRNAHQDSVVAELKVLVEKRDANNYELESFESQLQVVNDRLALLVSRWERLKLDGSPDARSLSNAVATAEDELRESEKLVRNLERVCRGLDAWYEDARIANIRRQIQEMVASVYVKSEDEVSLALSKQIQIAKSEVERAKKSAQFALDLSTKLLSRASEFNDLALKPLENRIQCYHDVLSPFRYRIRLSASSGKSAAALKQSVTGMHFGTKDTESQADAELSDGQISVQSLSTLFAAASAYRWSRWRALLLDDPLQSSDLLHTSSFLDILRGLIIKENYQVILSSHDMEEAKYIIRKCKQSGVSVTGCHLLGPTARGVRYELS